MRRKNIFFMFFTIMFLCLVVIPFTFSKYTTKINNKITINARQPEYNVIFDSNAPQGSTVTGSMSNEHFVYGTAKNLSINSYAADGYTFTGWCTDPDGNGVFYADGELVNKLTSTDGGNFVLYAQWRDYVAEINGTYYKTLQAAINAVPTNNVETTIKLLWNINESVTIASNMNIVLDLQNYTISNNGSKQVVVNNGTLKISNGTIMSSAAYAAIDNEKSGTIIMSGGSIIATGDRQAIYNGGIVEISGDAYLSSSITVADKIRGTVHNLADGTLKITGGTIVSTTNQAIYNLGNMTIGTDDENIDITTPVFQGATYGIRSDVDFNFYDGIIKGKSSGIYDETKVVGIEDGYGIFRGIDTINGEIYKTVFLGFGKTVTFDGNGGTPEYESVVVNQDAPIGLLPTITRTGSYIFDGWFTADDEQVTEETVITDDVTFYAHWSEVMTAEVNGVEYKTLAAAIKAVPTNNTKTTVKLLADTTENITVSSGQNIVFDLQNYTIKNSTALSVITNSGTVEISNGTITTNSANASAINNNKNAKIYISGGSIIATGQRQALYNDGGYAEVTGDAYLSSSITATGERGTVHNLANGTLKITGGTIVSTTNQALYNLGTMTIGTDDENIDITTPVFQGATYGVKSTVKYNFYDGIMKGKSGGTNNEGMINKNDDVQIVNETEIIDEETYKTVYLQ